MPEPADPLPCPQTPHAALLLFVVGVVLIVSNPILGLIPGGLLITIRPALARRHELHPPRPPGTVDWR